MLRASAPTTVAITEASALPVGTNTMSCSRRNRPSRNAMPRWSESNDTKSSACSHGTTTGPPGRSQSICAKIGPPKTFLANSSTSDLRLAAERARADDHVQVTLEPADVLQALGASGVSVPAWRVVEPYKRIPAARSCGDRLEIATLTPIKLTELMVNLRGSRQSRIDRRVASQWRRRRGPHCRCPAVRG